jgi:hypothetical protein
LIGALAVTPWDSSLASAMTEVGRAVIN